MEKAPISRATLGRLPMYLQFLCTDVKEEYVSASCIASAMGLGEILVRKDLSSVCSGGKPKLGFRKEDLIAAIKKTLGADRKVSAILVGAGQLGGAILGYEGFSDYGIEIIGAFDSSPEKAGHTVSGHLIRPTSELPAFCKEHGIRIGIITVPADRAQTVCDAMTASGITAILNFAPVALTVPPTVTVKNENLALSLAHLHSIAGV